MRPQLVHRLLPIASIAALTVISMSLQMLSVDLGGLRGIALSGTRPEPSAVIWLEAPEAPRSAPQMKTVHQRNLQFTPKVLAIRTGTTVDFPNEDRVFHNVFSFKDGRPFDLGIYPVGATKKVTFSEAGVTRLFCNIHPGMAAYIMAVDSPYFTAVNNDGTFAIPGVPPGTYRYHAWKPGRDVLSGTVTVQTGSTLESSLEVSAFVKTFIVVLGLFVSSLLAASVQAQSVTTELDVTSGYSSDARTLAGSAQLRTFGEFNPQTRFNVEGTWAKRSVDTTDAFNAAYAYGGHIQLNETYLERRFQQGAVTAYVRGGQYRTPFGIYSRADHGYTGFLRAPLIRSAYYWTVNNAMLERGIDVSVGTGHLSAELSLGTPGDNDNTFKRQTGLGAVVHVQAYYKSLIVGASHINSKSYAAEWSDNPGRMGFSSVDARWSYPGIQVRGEWIFGKEWTNDVSTTSGGYLDTIIHTRSMGPVTAVLRTEKLNWFYMEAEEDGSIVGEDWRGFRQTVGARIRIPGGLTAQFNVLRHSKLVAYDNRTAFDFALTYSIRANRTKRSQVAE